MRTGKPDFFVEEPMLSTGLHFASESTGGPRPHPSSREAARELRRRDQRSYETHHWQNQTRRNAPAGRRTGGRVLAGQIRRGMGETIRAVATSDGRPRIRYGLALHLGDVMYGNIGGDTRLDFTVIGPAVNLNSRMESMCKKTRSHALAFGRICAPRRRRGGVLREFELKGVAEKRPIYGLME